MEKYAGKFLAVAALVGAFLVSPLTAKADSANLGCSSQKYLAYGYVRTSCGGNSGNYIYAESTGPNHYAGVNFSHAEVYQSVTSSDGKPQSKVIYGVYSGHTHFASSGLMSR